MLTQTEERLARLEEAVGDLYGKLVTATEGLASVSVLLKEQQSRADGAEAAIIGIGSEINALHRSSTT